MTRRILTAALLLAPITGVLSFTGVGSVAMFVLASAALIPLAWLIGEATEHAAHHTGPGIGGFLNASFGNAPELIIALFAVAGGLTDVVRGSLMGSVIGNLLLVLGASLIFGGRGQLDRYSSLLSIGLVIVATAALLIPSFAGFSGDPDRHTLAVISLPIAVVLLVGYVVVTWISLRRHHAMHHTSDDPKSMSGWSFKRSLLVLGAATGITVWVAEILVGELEAFAESAGLSEFFIAAVIVAIVGNAAEHGGAVVVAARGNIKLAGEIALASSAQVRGAPHSGRRDCFVGLSIHSRSASDPSSSRHSAALRSSPRCFSSAGAQARGAALRSCSPTWRSPRPSSSLAIATRSTRVSPPRAPSL